MQAHELMISIGDTILVGEHELTVIDIEGDEVAFRVDASDEELTVHGDRVQRAGHQPAS